MFIVTSHGIPAKFQFSKLFIICFNYVEIISNKLCCYVHRPKKLLFQDVQLINDASMWSRWSKINFNVLQFSYRTIHLIYRGHLAQLQFFFYKRIAGRDVNILHLCSASSQGRLRQCRLGFEHVTTVAHSANLHKSRWWANETIQSRMSKTESIRTEGKGSTTAEIKRGQPTRDDSNNLKYVICSQVWMWMRTQRM